MRPSKGDLVKFTDQFVNNPPFNWVSALKDIEIDILKIKVLSLFPKKLFTVYFISGSKMYTLNINETGHFVDPAGRTGCIVFEEYGESQQELSLDSNYSWVPTTSSQSSKPATRDEANSTCPQCGSPAIDLIFSMKCTNPDCRNY